MRMKVFLSGLAVALLGTSALAQSTFFDKGQGGIGISGAVVATENVQGWQLSIGGTDRGRLDLNLSYGKIEKTNSVAFNAVLYLRKPPRLADPIAISLRVGLEYDWHKIRSATTMLAGFQLHRTLAYSNDALVELTLMAGFTKVEVRYGNGGIGPMAGVSLPIASGKQNETRIFMTPQLIVTQYRGESHTTVGFSAGFLFPLRDKSQPDDHPLF